MMLLKLISAIFVLFLLSLFNGVRGALSNTPGALVVFDRSLYDLETPSSLDKHTSHLLNALEQKYRIELRTYDTEDLSLFNLGEAVFEHLILFPSSKKSIALKGTFNLASLLEFINHKGNIVVIGEATSVLPEEVRNFLNEVGIYPSPKNFKLVDHFNKANNKVHLGNENIACEEILSNLDVDYDGGAALLSDNKLVFPIIKSSRTGFTTDEQYSITQKGTWTFGEQGFLAVGLQALNNARLSWVGSPVLLSDDLLDWTLQEKGVLKLQFVDHIKSDTPEEPNPSIYRITDEVIYTVGVSEYANGSWVPYVITNPENTIQLSFKMLDPYQRLNLLPLGPVASQDGIADLDAFAYFVKFKIPDQHGMFTYDLDYKRHGLSYLHDSRVVPVRHLANDEFKRSWEISNSWFYVVSASLVILGWISFVLNYIYVGNVDHFKKNI